VRGNRSGKAVAARTKAGSRRSGSTRNKLERGAQAAPKRTAQRKGERASKLHPAARKQAILDAALSVFAERGFEAARLEDVAARAGIAKGTLYLHFSDKEALFEELIRSAVAPIMDQVTQLAAAPDVPATVLLDAFFTRFAQEVLGTKRKLLLRLLISEGPRFPAVARFYHREVVSRGLALMRTIAERAARNGEFATDAPARFPQLIVAPLILSVVWDGLFAAIEPLDAPGLLRAHRQLLTGRATS
jgi:AcrR family transcriptional regulator